jgi:hypothetical protein
MENKLAGCFPHFDKSSAKTANSLISKHPPQSFLCNRLKTNDLRTKQGEGYQVMNDLDLTALPARANSERRPYAMVTLEI